MSPAARPGTIRGRALSRAGGAIEGARIMLEGSVAGHPDLAQLTAADGSFELRGLAAGCHIVRAVADSPRGTISAATPVDLHAGEDAVIELVLA